MSVARSDEHARRRLGAVALVLLGAAIVSGCSTTQDEAARLQLNSARIRAESHEVVHSAGHRLRVSRVSLLSSAHGSAFVVQVHNPGGASIADLPISIGIRGSHGRRVTVNAKSSPADELTAYFDAHLPAVAAGANLTWVYTTKRSFAHGARPFALVGGRPSPAVSSAGKGRPPVIQARVVSRKSTGAGRGSVQISLRNTSSVPQYQLGIYAVGRHGARPVAAGELTVPHLGSHKTQSLSIPVIGSLAHAQLELAAVPTIDQ
jgi:hypothetical protein